MVDLLGEKTTSNDIKFYSDASAAKRLGFGCLLNNSWIQKFWEEDFIEKKKPSIEYLELFALTAGILTWERRSELRDCRISIFCDNQAVVQMINNGMVSSCKNCMVLLRMLVLSGLKFNRRISAKFIQSKKNILADSLSRGQWVRFREFGPEMNMLPDTVSAEIWPVSKIWLD